MQIQKTIALAASLLVPGLPVWSADYADPTWPCVQRKVENLSLGLMWPDPVDPDAAAGDEALRRDVADLGDYLALRRIELEEARPRVAEFAAKYADNPEALGLVFAEVFATLSNRRTRIMSGIGRFSLSQIALADKIDTARAEMDEIMAADEPDYDRVDALEEQLDWDQTIYSDRQQSITFLCETPTLLERRLYSIAQMLQQAGG